MGKETSISALTESALFAGVCVVLCLARIYLAPLGIIFTFFCPIPIILVLIRNGLKNGIFSVLVATILVNFFSNPFDALMVFFWVGIVGIVFGESIKKNLSGWNILFLGSISSITGILVFLLFANLFLHFNPLDKIVLKMNQFTQDMIKFYKEFGIKETELEILKEMNIVLPKIMPFLIVTISLILSYFYFLVIQITLKKIGYLPPSLPPFKLWRANFHLIWGFIIGKFLTLIKISPENFLFSLGINLDFIFSFLFFVLGLSVVAFFLDKYKIPLIFKGIVYMISIFLGVFLYWLGVLDIFFNFRKIEREGEL